MSKKSKSLKCYICRKGFTPQNAPIYVDFYKGYLCASCLERAHNLFKYMKKRLDTMAKNANNKVA
jgi:hypothetical protein